MPPCLSLVFITFQFYCRHRVNITLIRCICSRHHVLVFQLHTLSLKSQNSPEYFYLSVSWCILSTCSVSQSLNTLRVKNTGHSTIAHDIFEIIDFKNAVTLKTRFGSVKVIVNVTIQ